MAKGTMVWIRIEEAEKARWEAMAKAAGLSVSGWIRERVDNGGPPAKLAVAREALAVGERRAAPLGRPERVVGSRCPVHKRLRPCWQCGEGRHE